MKVSPFLHAAWKTGMRSAHFEVRASLVIDRRNLPLTRSLEGIVMNEVDARHPHVLPHPSPIPMGKGSASFFGQQDAVYVTLINLQVHFTRRLFQRTHRFWSTAADWRGESWASGCSKPGRKWHHAHYRGEYFSRVFRTFENKLRRPGQTLSDQMVCDGFEKLFPHTCDLQRGYTVNTHTNFKAILGVVIPAPPSNLANISILQYNSMEIHGCMYTHACTCFHNYTYVHTHIHKYVYIHNYTHTSIHRSIHPYLHT